MQAASIELNCAKIIRTGRKLLMILFKLEMPVSDHFGGKYSHWTFLDALEMSNNTSLHKTASFDL